MEIRLLPRKHPGPCLLEFYASQLTSVEVNYTFRTLSTETQLQGWLDATPANFRFSFKAPQRITHFQRLRESQDAIAEFVASLKPVRAAGKLGPLLFQLPPNFAANNLLLASFLKASKLRSYQVAFEFRHPNWFTEDTYAILRRHNAALCVAESDDLATPDVTTADFHYYRLRRNGGYKPSALKAFAKRFSALATTREVFAYFKHEDEPTGALNAVNFFKFADDFSRAAAA
jgi:uncharacterized protein YecE (DUF72 family)